MLLSRLDRFNRRHPWNHNDYYGRWVAGRVVASGAREVLDIGCGTGNLAALLRDRGLTVTALEPDAATAGIAARRFAGDPAVRVVRAGFAEREPGRRWGAITLVAVLHHLPLVAALRELRESVAPGGRLVIVGCFRAACLVDGIAALPAVVANPVMGMIRHPAPAEALPPHMSAPVADPRETLAEIRAAVAAELPGARIRRRLFWRYSLVYDAPARE
ncbi:class I SAM-dependent methyltransferase [Nocardia rhamnosiphila]|uniref:Class I SAM-dependent methyltransferase n=1 Tax=Nocardia rhamnosiphila TaxID=426716 RepID=A0ABV2WLG0_9NOCA|nr:class I SAM-dependent methyltransferase [Nocardia rhamnosiphila]